MEVLAGCRGGEKGAAPRDGKVVQVRVDLDVSKFAMRQRVTKARRNEPKFQMNADGG